MMRVASERNDHGAEPEEARCAPKLLTRYPLAFFGCDGDRLSEIGVKSFWVLRYDRFR